MAQFDPSSFTVSGAKPMPVTIMLDNSGNMRGEKIYTLNASAHDILQGKEDVDRGFE